MVSWCQQSPGLGWKLQARPVPDKPLLTAVSPAPVAGLVLAAMESRWDVLSALGAVTCVWLLLQAVWMVAGGMYVYLLPQVRRGAPWLRAQGAWAGESEGIAPSPGV